jgi:predicted RNA-binding protein
VPVEASREQLPEPAKARVWLLVTRLRMWNHFRDSAAWFFHEHSLRQARRLRKGDVAVVYLTQEGSLLPSRLVATIEVRGEVDDTPNLGGASAFYPYRLPFRLVEERSSFVPFKGLVNGLEFISRKGRYGVYIQGRSAILLSATDGDFILRSVRSRSAKKP